MLPPIPMGDARMAEPVDEHGANWSASLSAPIWLKDGRTLQTLRDAAEEMLTCAKTRKRINVPLTAIRFLMIASITGEAADLDAATDKVRHALRFYGLLNMLL